MSNRDIEDIYPLSPMQQGMLYHSLYEPGSGVYVEQVSCSLVGQLNTDAFLRAWNEVLKRHTILRTSFMWEDLDEPLQIVFREVDLPIIQEDWSVLDKQAQDNKFEALLSSDVIKGFELSSAPLMRLYLIRIENETYKLVWTHHHLLLDGWSMPLLLKEVFVLYEAFNKKASLGENSEIAFSITDPSTDQVNLSNLLLRPARPYRDYIAWLKQQDLSKAEQYWRSYLKDFRAPTKFPGSVFENKRNNKDQDHPTSVPSSVAIESIHFSPDMSQRLRSQAQVYGITLNTWFQGAWALLLSRYSRENDVLFGATVSGRPPELAGVDSMLGLFINTLPVRVKIDSNLRVHEWLKSIQAQQAAGREYEYTPLVQAHEWSEVPSGETLFESILVFENYPVESSMREQQGSIQIKDLRHHGKTNYPFTGVIAPGPEIEFQIVFDDHVYQPAAINKILGHLYKIIQGMVENPEAAINSIKMLTPEEENLVLRQWNLDAQPADKDLRSKNNITDLFHDRVTAQPDQIALNYIDLDQQSHFVSYQELDHRSNLLASYLAELGVKSEILVGVLLERSVEMIVGLLGTLKANGAYVPLDPKYPAERLKYMLDDANIRILLTQSHLLTQLKTELGDVLKQLRVVCLDNEWDEIAKIGQENSRAVYSPDKKQAAYVVYTSGSTGNPKGVIVTQQSLIKHAASMGELMEIRPGVKMAQLISLSFDAAGEEIYPVLASGGTLILPPPEFELSGLSILDLIERYSINVLHLPAPLWHACVDDLVLHQRNVPESIDVVLVGGESPSPERLRLWGHSSTKTMEFINAYGPSEATITSSVYKRRIGPDINWPDEITKVPIGKPIRGARIFLLDSDLQPVPIGIPGEICIGGSGLARGYLGRPDLTNERFILNPYHHLFSDRDGDEDRIYRTGDLGRYLPDGNIEFLGRVDYQVKLRGFRIELEEIEAVLQQSEYIQDCVVLLKGDQTDNKRLLAYVVLNTAGVKDDSSKSALNEIPVEPKTIVKSIRQSAKEKLPDYMIPSGFITLAELPHMPNGKVDRNALMRLDIQEGMTIVSEGLRKEEYVAPRDAVEEIIAGLWQEVLVVDLPGIHDNFFDLGGHSLKATQLLSRVRQTFQAEISLRSLFESPTIASMAESVRFAMSGARPYEPIPLLKRDEQTGLPLKPPPVSFSQQRLWFLDQLDPGNLAHNIPAVVRIEGALDIEALRDSINGVVKRHESLRTVFNAVDGRPVQVIRLPFDVDLPLSDLSSLMMDNSSIPSSSTTNIDLEQEKIEAWITNEIRKPFDLSEGPLIRAAILRTKPSEFILVVTIHHIVSDGWSMGILVRDVAHFYASYHYNTDPSLPELKPQFAEYAAWQREWLSGDELERQLGYWKNKLAGMPPLLDLPTDRPRPALKTSNGALVDFSLPIELSEAIQALARQEGVTVYMLLLAAFQTLLYRYSGQEDISVGSAIANRTRPEVEGMIGFFVNTLVLRTDLSGKPSFRELLQQVREVALEAYAHQDLPFEMLVEALQPERNLSYTPLFQVGFDLQEVPVKGIDLPDLAITPINAHAGSAAFDMLMSINQSPGWLSGSLEYNTDLFDRSTIEKLLGHFQILLQSIVNDIEQSIVDYQFISKQELRQFLIDWNASEANYPSERCIHQLFEDQVDNQPESIAISYNGTSQVTYKELNRRANILAHYLIEKGVKPNSLVGVSTDRSIEMMVAILGIIKAGGAYLPLDPNYPQERLEFMLQDSQIEILICQKQVFDRLAELLMSHQEKSPSFKVLPIDTNWIEIQTFVDSKFGLDGTNNPKSLVTADDLAYVIYTSGSTGRPKGTLLRHRGLCNLVTWQKETFGIEQSSKVLQFSPFSFDASVWETFMALANGATLCLADQDVLANGLELIRFLHKQGITTVTLPPSLLSVLPEDLVNAESLPALKTVIAAGEACTKEIVQKWAPGRNFFNAYGPTETTVCASAARISVDENPTDYQAGFDQGDPSIGKPIANTQLYVVDRNLKPVPVGVPGELLIGGVGVAKGYWNRPELNAEKFIANPVAAVLRGFGIIQPSRMPVYRTGDLVRYRIDGNLEFLGRIDQQVKVRGFRIELGEIEAALRQFISRSSVEQDGTKKVVDAAVIAHDESGDRRLVAFVVLEQSLKSGDNAIGDEIVTDKIAEGEADLIVDLRDHLRQSLPEYMIPSAFVILDQLPLSPSGKVDRKALDLLALGKIGRQQLSVEFVAPRTETEIELCKITADLLGLQWNAERSPIGIADNFFEMGGHSLMATQLISRIRDSFQVELPLRMLFEHPTILELGEKVDFLKQSGSTLQSPAIQPVSREARRMKQTATGLTLTPRMSPSVGAQPTNSINDVDEKGGQGD